MNYFANLKIKSEPLVSTPPLRGAWLASLYLKNFRIHTQLTLSVPSCAPIVLTGQNGAGKTSLLEAVSLLAPGRGLRQAAPNQIKFDKTDENVWALAAELKKNAAQGMVADKINFICKTDDKTQKTRSQLKINNRSVAAVELTKCASLFWLTPAMARFYSEGTERTQRRKFMDRLVMGLEPQHAQHLTNFERLKKQRLIVLENNIPNNSPNNSQNKSWLEVLEVQMAQQALSIARTRQSVLQDLNDKMDRVAPDNFPRGFLSVLGPFESQCLKDNDDETLETYQTLLAQNRARDKVAQRTSLGTHQTDFVLFNKTQNQTAQQSSTGEIKALLVSLVMAAATLAAQTKNISSIVLLDEIPAHLDEARRFALFNKIIQSPMQMWLTGTDAKTFAPLKMDAHFFDIQPNQARPR